MYCSPARFFRAESGSTASLSVRKSRLSSHMCSSRSWLWPLWLPHCQTRGPLFTALKMLAMRNSPGGNHAKGRTRCKTSSHAPQGARLDTTRCGAMGTCRGTAVYQHPNHDFLVEDAEIQLRRRREDPQVMVLNKVLDVETGNFEHGDVLRESVGAPGRPLPG